jgi:hypothetical protein
MILLSLQFRNKNEIFKMKKKRKVVLVYEELQTETVPNVLPK